MDAGERKVRVRFDDGSVHSKSLCFAEDAAVLKFHAAGLAEREEASDDAIPQQPLAARNSARPSDSDPRESAPRPGNPTFSSGGIRPPAPDGDMMLDMSNPFAAELFCGGTKFL